MFSVDGITWDVPCSIKRASEVRASDISGILLDSTYFNDVLGTYMNYTVTMAVPFNRRDLYYQIYEILNQPVDGHAFVLPYNASTIMVTGRVNNISDVYVRMAGGSKYWKGIQFDVIANVPSKSMELGATITRGRAPLPDAASPDIGDTYTWNGTNWSVQSYTDADNISF